jgi:hypothetical protein
MHNTSLMVVMLGPVQARRLFKTALNLSCQQIFSSEKMLTTPIPELLM